MNNYVNKESVLAIFIEGDGDDDFTIGYNFAVYEYRKRIKAMPTITTQTLTIVAEHIKQRLYETAFNTNDEKASCVIENIIHRIDIWIDELKAGDPK